jgi:hypothetical protein
MTTVLLLSAGATMALRVCNFLRNCLITHTCLLRRTLLDDLQVCICWFRQEDTVGERGRASCREDDRWRFLVDVTVNIQIS